MIFKKSKLALVWSNSNNTKRGLYLNPQAITKEEIKSLKKDLKNSLEILKKISVADSN